MRIWTGSSGDSQKFQGGVVTIGKFDGLHLGHQKLLEVVRQGPKPWVVLTFDPLPIQVLQPDKHYARLMPKEDLGEQLPKTGVELLYVMKFDQTLAAKSAAEFAEGVIRAPFRPKVIVVGYDFAFGKNREGDLAWLRRWGDTHGIALNVVKPFEFDGETVSSGRVRKLIEAGAVDQASRLLGRPFYVRGRVIRGAGRGASIGVPTLNQQVANETLPGLGVYASRTRWRGQVMISVTNVGRVPTFSDGKEIHVETHVLNQSLSAYGETVDVDLIAHLRSEKKFGSVEDLKNQIKQDILDATRILG